MSSLCRNTEAGTLAFMTRIMRSHCHMANPSLVREPPEAKDMNKMPGNPTILLKKVARDATPIRLTPPSSISLINSRHSASTHVKHLDICYA